MASSRFTLRVKIGDNEIEVGGTREEVMASFDDLQRLVDLVSKAFAIGVVDVPAQGSIEHKVPSGFPVILQTSKCSEAVLNLLGTEWGKTPKTLAELKQGMEANAIHFPSSTISGTLNWLVKKARLRRWKGENKKYRYTLVSDDGR